MNKQKGLSSKRLSLLIIITFVLVGFISILIFVFTTKTKQGIKNAAIPKKIRLRFSYWGSPEVNEIYLQLIHKFELKNPDIEIIPELINQDYVSKLVTEIAGNSAPDIITTEVNFFKSLVGKNVLLDLTKFIEKDPTLSSSDFQPLVLGEFSSRDLVYSIPFGVGTYVIFYNQKLFRQAGLRYPPDSWDNDWWDWKTFLIYCKKLTRHENGNGRIYQFGIVLDRNIWDAEPWIYQNGGQIVNEDGSKCMMDSPQSIEAMQFLVDLSLKYRVAPTPDQTSGLGSTSYQMFQMERVAMFQSGYWWIGEFNKVKGLEWGITPLPKGKFKATGWHASGLSIWKGTKSPVASWRFVRYCASPESQLLCAHIGLQVPSRLSVATSVQFLKMEMLPSNVGIFNDGFKYAKRYPCIFYDPGSLNLVHENLDLAWNGIKPVPEVCQWITNNVNQRLTKKKE